jgi:hypothetical protein
MESQLINEQRNASEQQAQLQDQCQQYHRDSVMYREQLEQMKQVNLFAIKQIIMLLFKFRNINTHKKKCVDNRVPYNQSCTRKMLKSHDLWHRFEYDNNYLRIHSYIQQTQLRAVASVTNGANEMEQRVRQLTENLIHKQTTIESLLTDKNSLMLQMERLEVVEVLSIITCCLQ